MEVRLRREALAKLRGIAEYQFGPGAGEALFPDNVEITFSRRTGRPRYVRLNGVLLASLRPSTGTLTLTIDGFRRLLGKFPPPKFRVKVSSQAVDAVKRGLTVFAKHVVEADPEIRPGDEVAVVDGEDRLLAVGKAALSGSEMAYFKAGVAVKVRRGALEE
ncbi:MAG: PUA domain-containing protein [Candidatus Hecatellaceae archaeon]